MPPDPTWLYFELAVRDWTQSDLARRSGISVAHVSRLMSGERAFTLETYTAIARAFRVPLEDLLRLAGVLRTPAPDSKLALLCRLLHDMEVNEQERLVTLFLAVVQSRGDTG